MHILSAIIMSFTLLFCAACAESGEEYQVTIDWPTILKEPLQILNLPGYAPGTWMKYRDKNDEESLEVVIHDLTEEDSLEDCATKRLSEMQVQSENNLEILEKKAYVDGGYIIRARLKNTLFSSVFYSIYWRQLTKNQRLELNYSIGPKRSCDFADFDRIINSIHPSASVEKIAPETRWSRRNMTFISAWLPDRMQRTSPFRSKDDKNSTNWTLDAIQDGKSSQRIIAIPTDIQSPMFTRDQVTDINIPGLRGKKSIWNAVDPGMGILSQIIIRADIDIDPNIHVVLRGSGPPPAIEQLETELNILLSRLTKND